VTVLVALLLALFVLPHPWGVAAIVGALVVEVGEAWFWIWLSRRRRAVVGAEALIGAEAVVVAACRPDGQVRIASELWRAHCAEGADEGERVRVLRVTGLTLEVEAVARSQAGDVATESRRRG
jgi:membrane protein implicated in regulation of membrane protease activity